jgi:Zn-dependent peptidase ImmA (M78 family)
MVAQRRRAIYKIAENIRSALKLKTPADLHSAITDMLQGECVEAVLDDDISGKIKKIGNSFKITINRKHSGKRKNFTIAHELGHLFLHMGYLTDPEIWDSINEYIDSPYYRMGYSEEENEANQFAGALLMPEAEYKEFVRNAVKNQKINISLISSHFDVSDDAALTRGKWLGIFDWD